MGRMRRDGRDGEMIGNIEKGWGTVGILGRAGRDGSNGISGSAGNAGKCWGTLGSDGKWE